MIDNNKKQTKPEFVLISACNGVDCIHDTDNTYELIDKLKYNEFNFKQVTGCYNNTKELSFYVTIGDGSWSRETDLKKLLEYAKFYNQESILYVDSDRQAKLIFATGETINIGTFKQVPKAFALQHIAYTHDLEHNGYYITTETPIKEWACYSY